jgi:hypothetical protein
MKKLLLITIVSVMMIFASTTVKAQTPMSFSAHGGYSWLTGVLGAEAQFGNIGIAGGWMPTKMPMSGTRIHSYSGAVSYYTLKAGEYGYSYYVTGAVASQGFRYEDSWGGESTSPMTIVAIGMKYDTGGVWSKVGGGYGWCADGNAWTFEITLGFVLFGN